MLTYIKINGFKSFHDFEMTFTPLTVIAGINASGKSNLFDAIKLLSRLAEVDIKTAFKEQRGQAEELFTQYGEGDYATEMEFTVEMLVNREIKDNWGGKEELNYTRLRYQLCLQREMQANGISTILVKNEQLDRIKTEEDFWINEILKKENRNFSKALRPGGTKEPFIKTTLEGDKLAIKLRQDGGQGGKATPALAVSQTVLGGVNSVDFPHAFAAKEEMKSWRFLQLNPEDLREPTIKDMSLSDQLTSSGKNLAAVLFRVKSNDAYQLKVISRMLNSFLPNFTEVDVVDDQANRQLIIKVKEDNGKESSSRVLSEGTLRLLALCILSKDEQFNGLLCFEEPENGIHPFRIGSVAELLKKLTSDFNPDNPILRQVVVNTHSPVLLHELNMFENDHLVSVWLIRQNTLIVNQNGVKRSLRVSKAVEVSKTPQQGKLFTTEAERELSMMEVRDILNTSGYKN
jgi:predicted ATPase